MVVARATAGLARQTLVVVAINGEATLLAFLLWSFVDVFLLAFASVLVALLFRGLVAFVREQLSHSNAAVTGVSLCLLGIPLALTLGILSGLLNFIPNVGPLLAAAPAILTALILGPTRRCRSR